MVVSPSGSGAVRPKRKRRGRKVARVMSAEIPMAVRNGKAAEWDECGVCYESTRCIRRMKEIRHQGRCKDLITSFLEGSRVMPAQVLCCCERWRSVDGRRGHDKLSPRCANPRVVLVACEVLQQGLAVSGRLEI